jgi:hypothetical protein
MIVGAGCLCLLLVIAGIGAIVGAFKKNSTEPDKNAFVNDNPIRTADVRDLPRQVGRNQKANDEAKTRPIDARDPIPKTAKAAPKKTDPEPDTVRPDLKDTNPNKLEPDRAEEERKMKDADASFRLSAIKTLVKTGKSDVALRFAKELVRIYPDSAQAKEAQEIIKSISEKERK